MRVHIAFDFGNDTLKVAYAYVDEHKNDVFGKITERENDPGVLTESFYDPETDQWFHAGQADDHLESSLELLVQIQDLLGLLKKNKHQANNIQYYQSGNNFPSFFFPNKPDVQVDEESMADRVSKHLTFKVDGWTPKKVCESYFGYIASLIEKKLKHLNPEYVCRVLYSTKEGEWLREFERLLNESLKPASIEFVNSNKCLGYLCLKGGMLGENDAVSIFDIGENKIAAAKVSTVKGQLYIDGNDGHSLPMEVGGLAFDEAFANSVMKKVGSEMTATVEGSVADQLRFYSNSSQRDFSKKIKKLKTFLGNDLFYDEDGLSFSFKTKTDHSTDIKREDFESWVGVSNCAGPAGQIVNYIKNEVARPACAGVSRIILTGGGAETLGLKRLIAEKLGSNYEILELTFESENIPNSQKLIFAPAIGGALSSLDGHEFKMRLARTYGTFTRFGAGHQNYFSCFAGGNKGEEVVGNCTVHGQYMQFSGRLAQTTNVAVKVASIGLSLEELNLKRNELAAKGIKVVTNSNNPTVYLYDDGNSLTDRLRVLLEQNLGFRYDLNGEAKKIKLIMKYEGRQVSLIGGEPAVNFEYGFKFDEDGGNPCFYAANDLVKNKGVRTRIRFCDTDEYKQVYASQVEFVIVNSDTKRPVAEKDLKIEIKQG